MLSRCVWDQAVTTLSLIATAIVFCAAIGIPIGIWCARSDRVWRIVRPVLDIMQTTPTFVYLVPVVMLFGVGTVPGEVAVVITAMPPLIRFTYLGIRMVNHEIVETGLAFGADKRQLLWEVQLPLAIPTILGGPQPDRAYRQGHVGRDRDDRCGGSRAWWCFKGWDVLMSVRQP